MGRESVRVRERESEREREKCVRQKIMLPTFNCEGLFSDSVGVGEGLELCVELSKRRALDCEPATLAGTLQGVK